MEGLLRDFPKTSAYFLNQTVNALKKGQFASPRVEEANWSSGTLHAFYFIGETDVIIFMFS